MRLLILALIVLITWELYDRVKEKLPEWTETIKNWLGIKSPSRVYMDTCHAESAYKHDQDDEDAARCYRPFRDTSEVRRKANNRLRFLRELEDFCLAEGLDLKVWENFEFDALGIRLHDRKTGRAVQARIEKEKYENEPLLSAGRIKRVWKGANHEETETTD